MRLALNARSLQCAARTLQIRDACPNSVDAAALATALAPLGGAAAAPTPPQARTDGEPPPKAARTHEAAALAAPAAPAPAPAPAPAWAASDEELEACVAVGLRAAAPLLGASELQLEREWQATMAPTRHTRPGTHTAHTRPGTHTGLCTQRTHG